MSTILWSLLTTSLAHNLQRTTTIPNVYHKPDVIIDEMHQLCRIHEHMRCFTSHDIPYAVITGVDTSTHDVVIALQHSRELIAGEVAYHMLQKYAKQKPPHTLVIVPVVNICATKRVWAGEHRLRTSCSNIDLNRQFTDVIGSHKCEHHYNRNDGYQEWPGEQAISEPESKLLVELLLKFKPRTFLNIHSGEHSVYSPFDHDQHRALPHQNGYDHKLKRIISSHDCMECEGEHHLGAAYTHSSYSAWCSTGDYVVLNHLATYAWTLEVSPKGPSSISLAYLTSSIHDFHRFTET